MMITQNDTTNFVRGETDSGRPYNMYLADQRQMRSLSRREFAKALGISHFRYALIEKGYLKPRKSDYGRISEFLDEDFAPHIDGAKSYPEEWPDKRHHPVSAWLYRLLAKRWFHIASATLTALSLCAAIIGGVCLNKSLDEERTYYSSSYLAFYDGIAKKGKPAISLVSSFVSPEISESSPGEYVYAIRGDYDPDPVAPAYWASFWDDKGRAGFTFLDYESEEGLSLYAYRVQILDSEVGNAHIYEGLIGQSDGLIIPLEPTCDGKPCVADSPEYLHYTKRLMEFLQDGKIVLNERFSRLVQTELGIEGWDMLRDGVLPQKAGEEKANSIQMAFGITSIVGLLGFALFLFLFGFSHIYGESPDRPRTYSHSDALILDTRRPLTTPKTDWRFSPFLPETFFEVLGIALLLIGGMRVVVLSSAYLQPGGYASETVSTLPGQLFSIQFLAMFLLYFIDFDLFMDDRRVIRNIILYAMAYLFLYGFEGLLMESLTESSSVAVSTIASATEGLIPNNFGSAAMYFLLMFFLFYTPGFIKKKGGLIAFRSLAMIPVAWIFVSFFIGHGDVFFGWHMNLWVRLLFNGERFSYSLLAVSYLIALFFIKLHYKRKFGEKEAERYFMGNKFLFSKNLLVCLIIVLVWAMEFYFSHNAAFVKLGLGVNTYLILLVPLLLFYHPHKGPRNLATDLTTLFFYALAIVTPYVAAAAMFIALGGTNIVFNI